MKELLLASGNRGKLAEIGEILRGCVEKMYSAADFPGLPEVVEDGDTFESNARKKALSAAMTTGMPALADDSGLVVDALDGRPGVYSARFAGEGCGDAANNEKLLRCLDGIETPRRTAAFHCVAALCFPDGTCRTFCGELRGIILECPRGDGGFGYDPLFLVPEFGKTLAELDMETKNRISHRGRALEQLRKYISQSQDS
ncbi:MAG: XTP/dITP diphosphatase [Geobacteraceae bacterium]|nr:XTP/dITP diphosphatase [Geobacteraceae bacterium]